jgi:hypothetical protein
MAQADIPVQVRRFIARYIDSVATLEALLLLRSAPHETWDVSRVASRLYITESETSQILDRLCRDGLLACVGKVYGFECKTEELRGAVDELSALYSRHLIPVTNMIHAKSRRIREFADAFRIRKDS